MALASECLYMQNDSPVVAERVAKGLHIQDQHDVASGSGSCRGSLLCIVKLPPQCRLLQ